MTPHSKILVFILARRGCIAYANKMIELLPQKEIKIYGSLYADEKLPEGTTLIPTFTSVREFLWRSVVTLPIFILEIYRDFRQGYQIFYFPVFHHWNPVILLLAKILKAKTILTIHDAIFHPGEWQWGQAYFQNIAILFANKLVVLSEYVKNQLPIPLHSKTNMIPHPILLQEQLAINRVLPPRPRLLFLGRIAYYKGVDLLLEAVKGFSSDQFQKLTVAGLPMQAIHLPSTSLPIEKIERWLSESEIITLLAEHDILILPYREASQSGVVTLGISSAIPMIVTKIGGIQEQLAQEEALWVAPTVSSIRAGIVNLASNPDLYEQLHQNLVQKRAQASEENITNQLKILFRNT